MDVDDSSVFSIVDDGSLLILSRESVHSNENDLSDSESSTISNFKSGIKKLEKTLDLLATGGDSKEDNGANETRGEGTMEESVEEIDVSFLEINRILTKEKENLQLLQSANQMMEALLSLAKSESTDCKTFTGSSDVTSTNHEILTVREGQLPKKTSFTASNKNSPATVKPYRKFLNKISSKFRHSRQGPRSRYQDTSNTLQTFIQNYYRSLNSSNRYIIFASILSFFTAFCLLSWYSAQTHYHDLELFQLREKRLLANQETLEKFQLQNENFRESLIHQRYEETRACRSSLKTCYTKQEDLLAQISYRDQHSEKNRTEINMKMESQRKEIEDLKSKQQLLEQENKTLKKELAQAMSSIYAKLLRVGVNICRDRAVQFLTGTLLIVAFFVNLICTIFNKY